MCHTCSCFGVYICHTRSAYSDASLQCHDSTLFDLPHSLLAAPFFSLRRVFLYSASYLSLFWGRIFCHALFSHCGFGFTRGGCHPHSWTPGRRGAYWEWSVESGAGAAPRGGGYACRRRHLESYITHNGDLDFFQFGPSGETVGLDDLMEAKKKEKENADLMEAKQMCIHHHIHPHIYAFKKDLPHSLTSLVCPDATPCHPQLFSLDVTPAAFPYVSLRSFVLVSSRFDKPDPPTGSPNANTSHPPPPPPPHPTPDPPTHPRIAHPRCCGLCCNRRHPRAAARQGAVGCGSAARVRVRRAPRRRLEGPRGDDALRRAAGRRPAREVRRPL